MSVIESDLNVDTNYYFQVISNAYNIMSVENRNLIKEIKAMGHNIGYIFTLLILRKMTGIH